MAKRTQEEGGLQGGLYASSLGLLFHHSVSGPLFPYTLNKNNLPRPNCAQTWNTQWQRYWENLWLIPSSSLLVLERATGVERRVVRMWVWVEQSWDIDSSFLSFLLLPQQHHLLTSSYSSSFTEYCHQGFEYIRQALPQPSYLSSPCFSNSPYPYSPVHHCSAHFISHCKSAVDIYRTGLKYGLWCLLLFPFYSDTLSPSQLALDFPAGLPWVMDYTGDGDSLKIAFRGTWERVVCQKTGNWRQRDQIRASSGCQQDVDSIFPGEGFISLCGETPEAFQACV